MKPYFLEFDVKLLGKNISYNILTQESNLREANTLRSKENISIIG